MSEYDIPVPIHDELPLLTTENSYGASKLKEKREKSHTCQHSPDIASLSTWFGSVLRVGDSTSGFRTNLANDLDR
jgi:hypothetical protein